jgi:hypothetical protein
MKIKEIVPKKYHSYIDKFDLNNKILNNSENQKVSMDINED